MLRSQPLCLAIPLYEQVYKVLLARIEAREWPPHSALPSETTLAQEFGVSVGTVRKAMDQLSREHLLTRERGRGTFVRRERRSALAGNEPVRPPIDQPNRVLTITDHLGTPTNPKINLVSCWTEPPSAQHARALWPENQTSQRHRVLKLVREWRLEESLVCHEVIVLDNARFHDLRNCSSLEELNLFGVYEDRFQIKVDRFRWEIEAAMDQGSQLMPEPLVALRRTTYDQNGIFEVCEQTISLCHCSIQLE